MKWKNWSTTSTPDEVLNQKTAQLLGIHPLIVVLRSGIFDVILQHCVSIINDYARKKESA